MNKALITGSSGLVGSESVRFLCDRGWRVHGIDNNTRAYLFGEEASTDPIRKDLESKYSNFLSISADIRNKESVDEILKLQDHLI